MNGSAKHILFLGYGYVAKAMTPALIEAGFKISATSRSAEKREELKANDIFAYAFDDPFVDLLARKVSHILVSTPPDPGNTYGGEDCPGYDRIHYALKDDTWVGYLSATSVYGDTGGEWVDETTKPKPTVKRGHRRLQAEKHWIKKKAAIFRLGAIYGPDRNIIKQLQEGKARLYDAPDQLFSRIYVNDIAQVVMAAMELGVQNEIFNVVDDCPSIQADVVHFVAETLGVKAPTPEPLEDAPPSVQDFYKDKRRVRNDKIKKRLAVSLNYPDYKFGYRALFQKFQNLTV